MTFALKRPYRRCVLVLVVFAVACAAPPNPSGGPSSPSVPATPLSAACGHRAAPPPSTAKGSVPGTITLVGWIDGGIAVAFPDLSCIYRPLTGAWEGLPGDQGGAGSSSRALWADGGSWATIGNDRTMQVTAAGIVRSARPAADAPWLGEWGIWDGVLLHPVPAHGYVVPSITDLVRLSEAGALTDIPLPSGFVTVTVASDGTALVRETPDRTNPSALNLPYALYRWTPGMAKPAKVADGVRFVYDAEGGLAWVAQATGEIRSVAVDGRLGPSVATWNPTTQRPSVSPDGTVIVRQPLDGSFLTVEEPPETVSQRIDLACGQMHWSGNALACLVSPRQPGPDPWNLVVRLAHSPAISVPLR